MSFKLYVNSYTDYKIPGRLIFPKIARIHYLIQGHMEKSFKGFLDFNGYSFKAERFYM